MWLIEGSFDQGGGINLEQKKFKLLKPGRSYPLGRKPKHALQLVLSHPKISGEHVTFVVGESSVDFVNDPTIRPTLRIQNLKNKALQVSRNVDGATTRHLVQPMAEDEIIDGDCIALVTGIYVNIKWMPVCCFAPPKTPTIPFDKCASLGVNVVSTPRPEITHHLTSTLSTSTTVTTSLLTLAHIVRPEWLTEVLHLGSTASSADGPSALESDFRLPSVSQYLPASAPALPPPLKSPSIWEPNRQRSGMLKGWRFVFVGEKGREVDAEMRTLVERGGGEYEVFDVSTGKSRWNQALSRNKRKVDSEGGKGISVVADTETLQIAVGNAWEGILEELKSSDLQFISRSQLLEAIFFVDTSRLNSSLLVETEKESPLPDRVPNTHEEEPSASSAPPRSNETSELALESAPRARPKKRLSSPKGPTTPTIEVQAENIAESAQVGESSERASMEPDGTAGRRRPLIRRARAGATQTPLLGVDDPTLTSFTLSQTPEPQPNGAPPDSQIGDKPPSSSALPTGRSSRLKKRARTDIEYNPILASLEQEIAAAAAPPSAQPPLKRFKALFDETDPDRVESQMALASGVSGSIAESQTVSQLPESAPNGHGAPAWQLGSIREEEESMSLRTGGVDEDEDLDMGNADDTNAAAPSRMQSGHPSKAAAPASQTHVAAFDSTQVAKPTESKGGGGAAPGKPDTDAAFLQALASTKKGKRREDDFDREFNNLRISKPELEREAEAAADDWRVLADFGDESNIMGNFMVIVEMDVPDKGAGIQSKDTQTLKAEWCGRPDFKKFKKKTFSRQRPSVELVADVENDYGMGPAYWKGSQSQSQSQGAAPGDFTSIQQQSYLQPSQTQNRGFLQPKAGTQTSGLKPRNQSQSQVPSKTVKAEAGNPARSGSRTLSIVGEDEDEDEVHSRATRRTPSVISRKEKSQPLFLDDDDDGDDDFEKIASLDTDKRDDMDVELDLDDIKLSEDDEPTGSIATLRSTAPSATHGATRSRPKSQASPTKKGAKRSATLLEEDSDSGVVFKGFGGKKKARAY